MQDFPATADLFTKMAEEEDGHRHRLSEEYRRRFGEHIPLIRRQDVKGFQPVGGRHQFTTALAPGRAREEAALMEIDARRFYEAAAHRTDDAGIRQLLDDLAQEEGRHEATAEEITEVEQGTERTWARCITSATRERPGCSVSAITSSQA